VPVGGTAGQVLSKINATDYNTQWIDFTAGTASTGGVFGVTTLTDSVASTSTTTAAVPNSVKTSYDFAATKAKVSVGTAAPVTPSTGDVWVDTAGTATAINAVPLAALTGTGAMIYGAGAGTAATLAIGSTDQQLVVSGGVPAWATSPDIAKNTLTTTGDIIYASGSATPARLGIGTASQVLSVSGGVPAWTTPSGGGYFIEWTGTKAGTALGVPTGTYEVRNAGGGVTNVTIGGFNRTIAQYESFKIAATSEMTDFGVASPFTMGTTTVDSTGTALDIGTASAAVYGSGLYLVGKNTGGNSLYSTNGTTWTKFTIDGVNNRTLEEFAYGNGNYVAAAGGAGSVYKSTSGTAGWTAVSAAFSSPASNETRSVLYGGGTWVVVGDAGALSTSTDLVTFTQRTSNITGQRFNQIAYSGSLWVVVGGNPSLITSSDATTWTTRTSGFSGEIRGVAYGNGLFVAVGDSGGMITSTDGISWTARTSQFSTTRIWNVVYTGSRWFAVGESGKMSTSTNGTTWTSETSGFGATGNIQAIAYGGGKLFGAAGYSAATPAIGTKVLATSAVFNPVTYSDLG
jgi:hypothetical protein